MSMYKYVRELWKQPKENLGELWKKRLLEWKTQPVTIRVDRPTRIDKARSLGYRAKQGYIIVRQRVGKGGHTKPKQRKGRRTKRASRRKNLRLSYQAIAEMRAARKYVNCEVLNSYYVGEDNESHWYEVILVDKSHPSILADKRISWIANPTNRGRIYRGLTSATKKSKRKI